MSSSVAIPTAQRDRRHALRVRCRTVRLHNAVSVSDYNSGQHSDSFGSGSTAHANANQHTATVYGDRRLADIALPSAMVLLHVHIKQPLEAPLSGVHLLCLLLYDRSYSCLLSYRLHMVHAIASGTKVLINQLYTPSQHGMTIILIIYVFDIFKKDFY